MTTTVPTFRSRRLRLTIGDRVYTQLTYLAELAELEVPTEARLLLQWGIEMALRRWQQLSQPDDPLPGGTETSAPPAVHVLPMFPLQETEVSAQMDEVHRRVDERLQKKARRPAKQAQSHPD